MRYQPRRAVVRYEISRNIVLLLRVRDTNRIGRSFGPLKCIGDSERDVLAVVANDIIFERRTTLIDYPIEALSLDGAKNLSDIFAMKNRAHARHLFRCGYVEFRNSAAGDRRLNRNGIQHPGEVEVGGVLRLSGYLQRAIYARRLATDGDVVGASCVVGMFGSSLGSLCRELQRVHKAAFQPFTLKPF
jgi:hypothetical protein